MYLLVFITLVISLIGLYSQVLTVQTSQLVQQQNTVAQQMLRWHATAVAQARNAGLPAPGAVACEFIVGGSGNNPCQRPGFGNVVVGPPPTPGGWTTCDGTQAPPCWTSLPPDYQADPYAFFSVYYAAPGEPARVATCVPPPLPSAANPAPGLIVLPGEVGTYAPQRQIGITISELLRQIKKSGFPPTSYGTVMNSKLVTPVVANGSTTASLQYTLPVGVVPPGATDVVCLISNP